MQKSINSYQKCVDCPVKSRCFLKSIKIDTCGLTSGTLMLHAGESFLQIDEPLKNLYVVKSGFLKNVRNTEDGNEIITGFTFSGEVIDVQATKEFKSITTTVALETTLLCFWPFDHFFSLFADYPEIAKAFVLLVMQKKADDTLSFINRLMPAIDRVEYFLRSVATRTKCLNSHSQCSFQLSMSREEIGNYLNLTTETVSRALTQLQNLGIIQVNKKNIHLV